MRVIRIILGILFALVALFAGGCAILFFAIFVEDAIAGYGSPADLVLIPLSTLVLSGLLFWLAWVTLRVMVGRPRNGGQG